MNGCMTYTSCTELTGDDIKDACMLMDQSLHIDASMRILIYSENRISMQCLVAITTPSPCTSSDYEQFNLDSYK